MTYLLGLDLGTIGAKAIIVSTEGEVISQGYYEYPCKYPKPAWVEQDVDLIVARSMDAARVALADAGIDPKKILAVSFSSQRCCTILIDREGKLVRPMISWQDNRSREELEILRKEISEKRFYQITGLPLNTTWIIGKLLWLKRNEPESFNRTARFVQLHAYVMKAWGAEDYVDDYSDAGFYGVWDTERLDWHAEFCDLVGIEPSRLPQIGTSGTVIGQVGPEAARKTGLLEGTPLCIGAGDQNAAAVGAGVVLPGSGNVSLGTGGAAVAYSETPFRDPNEKTMVTHHPISGKWMIEGYQAGAASVYRWFRDEIASLEKAFACHSTRDVYSLLDEMVASVPPGSRGLVLLPYFAGSAAPRWNPDARGTLIGLTFAHDRSCLVRAFMEGITLEVRDMLQSIRNAGVELNDIRILGGPTRSHVWNQIQSDVYGCSVQTLKQTDAAAVGAAIFAGVGAGVFEHIVEGCRKMVKIDRAYTPVLDHVPIYDRTYNIFCQAYEALTKSGVFSAVAESQA
ncbi:MAG: FGGY family carbohydrate kinase [Planctomycetaceae bacterium]|nr:FGGY family carbohydrate kinase [Planctomycetaceae bacterium]